MSEKIETYSMVIHGLVQGVGFRQATVRQAHELKVTGWVRNLENGTVETLIQGSPEAVDQMLQWLRFGSPRAKVSAIESHKIDNDKLYGHFERR